MAGEVHVNIEATTTVVTSSISKIDGSIFYSYRG